MVMYIGDVFKAKMPATVTIVLALAPLGGELSYLIF